MLNAVIIHKNDSVVISTAKIKKNSLVKFKNKEKEYIEFKAVEDIPIYHKIGLKEINKDDKVYKYGECIGKATQHIKKGAHVHTHNLKSLGAN